MQSKRDYFVQELAKTPFAIRENAGGSYFQLAGFEKIRPEMSDKDFAVWLTEHAKVTAIPVSSFYHNETDTGLIRFCFAKKQETIQEAMANLKTLF